MSAQLADGTFEQLPDDTSEQSPEQSVNNDHFSKHIHETFLDPDDAKSPLVNKTSDIIEAIGNLEELRTTYGCSYELLTSATLMHKNPHAFQKITTTLFRIIKDLKHIIKFMRDINGECKFTDEPYCLLDGDLETLHETTNVGRRNSPIGGLETASLSNCRAVCMRAERRVLQIIDCGLYNEASVVEVKKYLDKLGQWSLLASNVLRRR